MTISYRQCCKNCGETLEGDGYSSVLYCPYTDEDTAYMEPDSGPIYCDFPDYSNSGEENSNE